MKVIISKYFKLLTFDDSSPIFEKISRIWRQRVISSFSPTLQLFKNHFKANQNKQTNKQILVALKVFQNILKPKWKERKKERKKETNKQTWLLFENHWKANKQTWLWLWWNFFGIFWNKHKKKQTNFRIIGNLCWDKHPIELVDIQVRQAAKDLVVELN